MAKQTNPANQFAEIVYQVVVESAANTLTFAKLETGYGTLDRAAWIIHRMEYYLSPAMMALLVNTADAIHIGLTRSNLITSLSLESSAVIDMLDQQSHLLSGVGFADHHFPVVRDFSSLPGGGLLTLPNPLYLAVQGESLASAVTVRARIHFSRMDMEAENWIELVEQTRLLT